MVIHLRRRRGTYPTVFHITHYKAGSQWVYAFLKLSAPDRIVVPRGGATHVADTPFREGAVYPAVYLRRDQLDAVSTSGEQRRFLVIRDLRDTLISLYFSLRYSHSDENPHVSAARPELARMDERSGLVWTMEHALSINADIQRSWLNEPIPMFRYEKLIADEYGEFEKLATVCELEISRRRIHKHVRSLAFERLSGRRTGTEDRNSHLRKGISGDWRNHFDEELKSRFKELYGDVLIKAGYECSDDW